MSQPEISIVIPTYNSQKYIPDLLQSLEGVNNAELIFVDDGSRDNTIKCIKSQVNNMSSSMVIRVIESSHGGPSIARNLGISRACGRYIVFVDSDDLIDSKSINRATHNNFSEDIISFSNKSRDRIIKSDDEKYDLIWNLVKNSGTSEYSAGPVSKFFRTEFLRKNLIEFHNSLYKGEDLLFNVAAIECAKSIRCESGSFYTVRYTKNSITRGIDPNALNNGENFVRVGTELIDAASSRMPNVSQDSWTQLKKMLIYNSYKNDASYALRHQINIDSIIAYDERFKSQFGELSKPSDHSLSLLESMEVWMLNNHHFVLIRAYMLLMRFVTSLRS